MEAKETKETDEGRSLNERNLNETIAQLMFSLNGERNDRLYNLCVGGSPEFANIVIDFAKQFEEAWASMSPHEHEEAGHDYIEEIDKLAEWIGDHAEDIVKNNLEYPSYPCEKAEWAVVKTVYDTGDGKILYSDRTVLDGFDNGARGCVRDAYRRFVANDIASYITEVPHVYIQNFCFTNDLGGTAVMYDNPGYKRTPNRIEWRLEKRVNGKEVQL